MANNETQIMTAEAHPEGYIHKGESPFMTAERRVCPICKQIYNYEYISWNPVLINRFAHNMAVTK